MKSLVLLFAAYFIFIIPSFAQAPDTIWTKTFGGINDDRGYSVQQTIDGGYIIVGCTYVSGAGVYDVWLIKTDFLGDTLWTKTFGGVNWDIGYSVQQTTDGGYIITGARMPVGGSVLLLIKTDSLGDTLWTKTYSGFGFSVQQTSDGGYIIVGVTGFMYRNIWLLKTDSSGDTLWTKTYGVNYWAVGNSVYQTSDEGYIIVGSTNSFGAGEDDVWLLKTDENGDTSWTRTYGGITGEEGYSVQQTNDGGYIIVGYTDSFGAGEDDIWLIKTDDNGDTLWTRTYGGSNDEEGFSVWQTTDSGYVIAGYTNSFGAGEDDVWIIKTNTNGDTLWTKTVGGESSDYGESIQQTADGGYIVTGYTNSFGAGEEDVWLIKLDADSPSIVNNEIKTVDRYSLEQNYPNPFNPNTTIKYQIPELSFVTLKVYDVLGSEVAILVNEEKSVGRYEIEFDATILSSGIYFYRIQAGSFVETKKMVLMK